MRVPKNVCCKVLLPPYFRSRNLTWAIAVFYLAISTEPHSEWLPFKVSKSFEVWTFFVRNRTNKSLPESWAEPNFRSIPIINALILILRLCCVMFLNREKYFLVYNYLHVIVTAISNFLHVLGAHTQVTHCSWTFQKRAGVVPN